MKTFDRLISAPISLHALVLGESLSGTLYSIGIAAHPPRYRGPLLREPDPSPVVLLIALLLSSFCFASMGTLFASYPTEKPATSCRC